MGKGGDGRGSGKGEEGDRTFHPPIGSLNFLHSWKISLKSVTPLTSQAGTGPYLAMATGLCKKSQLDFPPPSSRNALTAARIVSLVFGGQRA